LPFLQLLFSRMRIFASLNQNKKVLIISVCGIGFILLIFAHGCQLFPGVQSFAKRPAPTPVPTAKGSPQAGQKDRPSSVDIRSGAQGNSFPNEANNEPLAAASATPEPTATVLQPSASPLD
jgi:hypothetical protein